MRLVTISGTALILSLALNPAYAGQKGKGGGPKTTTTKAHGPSVKTTPTTKAQGPAAKPVKVAKADAKIARADAKVARADAKAARAEAKAAKKSGTADTTTTTNVTTADATTIDFAAAPNGQKLTKNSALRSKLETRLAALGYTGTVYEAAYGFKNLGQFVAATNVAQNHTLSFEQLKLQMTGLSVMTDPATGEVTVMRANLNTADGTVTLVPVEEATNPAPTKSLGQSIQTLSSGVDATLAANTATTQANSEIDTTSVSK
jgi:hypothetical protein